MKAILMAGGEGTRLRPMTCCLCKPMVPMFGKPVMAYAVELLKRHGFDSILATLQYRPQSVLQYFGDELEYRIEEQPLGTAGSVKRAEDFLAGEAFVVMSGDALTDIDLAAALRFHRQKGAMATLVLKKVNTPTEYGLVVTDENGRIERFVEKPGWGDVCGDMVNTGIYILEPEVLQRIPDQGMYDFGKELFPTLVKAKEPVFGYAADGYWCDVGSCESYLAAMRDAMEEKIPLYPAPKNGIYIHPDALVEPSAQLEAPCWIGPEVFVGKDCRIGPFTVLERGACVQSGAKVSRSALWSESKVGKGAECRGSVMCRGAQLGSRAEAYEGTVIGENACVGEAAVLSGEARLWPYKSVEPGAVVHGPLVWGSGSTARLTRAGICGGREDLPIEKCVQLGVALAELERRCAVAQDGSGAARMMAEALLAGLCAGGARVYRMGALTPQAMRQAAGELNAALGVHVRCQGEELVIELSEKNRLELSENARRRLAGLFARGDAPRVPSSMVRPPIDVLSAGKARVREEDRTWNIQPTGLEVCVLSDSQVVLQEMRALSAGKLDLVQDMSGVIVARIAGNGRDLELTDETGATLESRLWPQIAAYIAHERQSDAPIYAAADASQTLQDLAESWHVPLVRAGAGQFDLSQMLSEKGGGREIWQKLYFDAPAALLLLCEYLAMHALSLHELSENMRRRGLNEQHVFCPDSAKAAWMSRLLERTRGMQRRLDHGVHIRHSSGWAMISPSEDKPEFRILCEGDSQEFADELGVFYLDLLSRDQENLSPKRH